MVIKRYKTELMSSNMYVIIEGRHALIIDPCNNVKPAANLIVDRILLTHEHYDHISGVNDWKNLTGADVMCSNNCAVNIMNPRKNMSRYFNEFCALQTMFPTKGVSLDISDYVCKADMIFENETSFCWQGHTVTLIEIPGHSLGSIGIYVDESGFLTGDSLFKDCDTELRLPGGSIRKWKEVGEKRIEAIPRGIKVWPGHFDCFVKT